MNQFIRDAELEEAARQQEAYGIPIGYWRAWRAQRDSARRRGIPFQFDLLHWYEWWMAELRRTGGTRGRGSNRYSMLRVGDRGAYEEANVYAGTPADNAADLSRHYDRSGAARARHAAHPEQCWLRGTTGAAHPRSRAVVAPDGTNYSSATAAALVVGCTRQHIAHSARWRLHGWRYDIT